MASLLLIILFIYLISPTQPLTLPLTKHHQTAQYLTHLNHTQPQPLLLDLSGPLVWTHCGPLSPTPTPLPCRSIHCSSTRSHLPCPASPSTSPCSLMLHNPLTGSHSPGYLVDYPLATPFLLACSPAEFLHGLPRGASGVLGLAGQSQTHAQRFDLCLPSSGGVGVLTLGGVSGVSEIVTKSLVYTPLLPGNNYAVNLRSIKIGDNKIGWGEVGTMKISTTSPFSRINGGIYDDFMRAFVTEAKSLNMTRVANVGPFEACYKTGGKVPVVDLMLQSEMVMWRVYEHNLMVKVKEDVMCLGFLNGGSDLDGSVVLGGYQLEDNLLEFDLSRSMLGFSSSLIAKQKINCLGLGELAMFNNVQSL